MKTAKSHEVSDLYEDECIDAGGTEYYSAWDAILVFINAVSKNVDSNKGFNISKMEDLFLKFINEVCAEAFNFEPCDSKLLNRIVKDMSEMGYLDKHGRAKNCTIRLNDIGLKQANETFESMPKELKKSTNEFVKNISDKSVLEAKLGRRIKIFPKIKNTKFNKIGKAA